MGLKDLFKKGVDAVVSIKEKATQAMADYKQMVAEVETEAGQWKTFDPDFLRAVLDGRLAAAYDLYVAKTGASPAKAKMLVKKSDRMSFVYIPEYLRRRLWRRSKIFGLMG